MTTPTLPRVAIIGPCASGKSTLRRALLAHGYDARISAQEHSAVPDLWQRMEADILIGLQAELEAVRLRRNDARWSAQIWSLQQERLAPAFAKADYVLDTSSLSVDAVVSQVLEFLGGIVQDSLHE
ncbi:MAG TPA: hypothetical protein PK819_08330 [Thermomicrobiales bacterium]|nr:hypothetical protein [Thermomicrobiales bacterium]